MSLHLIHVGFPKTGSTYLQAWFAAHPEIAFSPHHLLGFGSVYRVIEQTITSSASQPRVTSCEDFSAPTLDHREWPGMAAAQVAVCHTLHDLFPQAHILIVTRGYRGIIESGHAELVRFGRSELLHEFVQSPTVQAALPQILDYDRLIAHYRARFGERVTVLPFELLRDDPAAFLLVVEGVLGVAPHRMAGGAINERLTPAELRWHPAISRRIERLPVGSWLRGKLTAAHILAIRSGKLRGVAQAADRWLPAKPQPSAELPQEVLAAVRDGARQLVKEPFHSPYAADYIG